jgi:HlyD family secretion protein
VVVRSEGKIVSTRNTIVMKPLERAVIKEVVVKVGNIVEKDDILIIFDPTINNAEAERLKNEIAALDAQFARLKAEFESKPYSGGTTQFEQWQLAIYKQRQEYYKQRMLYFEASLNQIDASQKAKRDSLNKQQERLAEVKKLEAIFANLEKKKASPLTELLQITIDRMEMEATVEQLTNDILELDHRRVSIQAEKDSFIQEWKNDISENMVTVERDLTSAQKEYAKIAQLIEYVYLRAPCRAMVHEVASFSAGSAVREAEAVITLIPLDEEMEVEAEVAPEDIGKVHKDAEVRIKLSAYPFQKYGTLNGTVINLSEDTLEKQTQGTAAKKYYRARIKVSGELNGVENFRLIPGMETQCEIKCGRRRVIEYILYPLLKAFDETAREP